LILYIFDYRIYGFLIFRYLKYKIDLYLKDVHARNLYVQLMLRHNAVTSFFRTVTELLHFLYLPKLFYAVANEFS